MLLESDRLWVRGDNLTNWQQQVDRLDLALSRLAQTPTLANYQAATVALQALTEDLPKWMRLESLESPYRITAWVNRLEAIDAMLRYGKQRQLMSRPDVASGRP